MNEKEVMWSWALVTYSRHSRCCLLLTQKPLSPLSPLLTDPRFSQHDHMPGPCDGPGWLPGCFARCSLSQNPLQLEVATESSCDEGNTKSEEEFLRKLLISWGKWQRGELAGSAPSPGLHCTPRSSCRHLGKSRRQEAWRKTKGGRGER